MILTKEFVAKLNCPDAEPWIDAHSFWGKTTDELLDALKIDNPSFFEQASTLVPNVIALEVLENNNYTLTNNFKVVDVEYTILNDAINKANEESLILFNSCGYDLTVNLISLNDNGDETWTVLNLDAHTEDGFFAVFNPLTGIYTKTTDLASAKSMFNAVKQSVKDLFVVPVYQKIIDNDTQDEVWIIYNQ
jgi:hypothetical protein